LKKKFESSGIPCKVEESDMGTRNYLWGNSSSLVVLFKNY
jgi:hypothetical protein